MGLFVLFFSMNKEDIWLSAWSVFQSQELSWAEDSLATEKSVFNWGILGPSHNRLVGKCPYCKNCVLRKY